MQPHIIFTYTFNLGHLEQLVKDLSDEQMVQQPNGVVSHPAWTLGHLAAASSYVAKVLGLESTFPADWEERFKTGGVPSADASTFPSKDAILAELRAQHQCVADAIVKADPAIFSKELPDEGAREHFPTIGDFCSYLMTAHEGNHIGQIAAWRRAMGLGSAT
jgi:hypothetical protein